MRIRLDQITVKHFKRIEELTINLKPVTALVGGNTSGKSSAACQSYRRRCAGSVAMVRQSSLARCRTMQSCFDRPNIFWICVGVIQQRKSSASQLPLAASMLTRAPKK